MSDAKGPYKVEESPGAWWCIVGPNGYKDCSRSDRGLHEDARRLNAAYAAGRASRDAEVKVLRDAVVAQEAFETHRYTGSLSDDAASRAFCDEDRRLLDDAKVKMAIAIALAEGGAA